MTQMRCPRCRKQEAECQENPHVHRCRACGYDGTNDSEVGRARPDEAVEAECRQDQAELCNSAPPSNTTDDRQDPWRYCQTTTGPTSVGSALWFYDDGWDIRLTDPEAAS